MTTIVPPSSSATKKPSTPGQPWSHLETTALIDAYESKWYFLNRGQLKAQQWDEVAATVAARCAVASPAVAAPHHLRPKSGTQCRHKIEKLRKRYRSEKNRPVPSLWPYFDRMDRMERGPVPISMKTPADDADSASNDDDDDDNEIGDEYRGNGSGNGSGDGVGVLMEVAREVRRMGEGMVRVEKRRMEMMREVERGWMETEAKRAEMVLEAQRGILDSIAGAFAAMKKARKTEDL